jgi:transposase-like protein
MERSHIPLSKWLMAAHVMAASKKGFSAHELHRVLDISYEGAWFLFHRLRTAANDIDESGPIGGPGKPIEADETYIGGREKNKHANKRSAHRHGGVGKMAVVSLVDRDGRTKSFHVANVTAANVRDILEKHADPGSYLMTDESNIYLKTGEGFARHWRVHHTAGQYTKIGGYAHTNSAESHFSLLKRGVYGTFHSISEAHLHRYLAEFDFRANTRDLSDETGSRLAGRGQRQAAPVSTASPSREPLNSGTALWRGGSFRTIPSSLLFRASYLVRQFSARLGRRLQQPL